jgi:hypothetical protein
MRRFLASSTVAIVAMASVLSMSAQSAGSGSIAGTLTDKAGAHIPNEPIVIKDTDTGAVRTVTSNAAGSFIVPFLQPGHYEVVLGGGAYGKVDRKDLVVTVGDTLALDTVLPLASVSSEVVVSATDEPVLDTAKTSVSQTLDQALVSNLPVNGRRFDNFALLTTNVVPDGNSGILSFRGISGLFNENLVDGTSNNQAFFSEARGRSTGAPYVYSVDSIQEFAASASGYSAEFGAAAGGQINAITKSGTNALHGDLFYYLRYPALNALDPYNKWNALHNGGPSTLLTPTIHQQQQFGGSVGGPIIKDKLFYFFTYDGYRKVNPIFYTSSVNSATILGYSTTDCPSPLTAAQCSAASNYIVSELGAFPRNVKQDIFFPKLDYQLNEKNHISAQFLWDNFHQPNGYNSSATVNNGSVTQNGTADYHERIFIASWETVLSSHSANALHGQWSRDLETDTTNSPGPAFSLGSLFAYGETSALPRPKFPDEHRIEAFDVYSWEHGKHSVKGGVDLNFIHEQLENLFQGDGSYSYSGATALANYASWVQDVYGVNGAKHYSSFTQVTDAINKTAPGLDDFWNKNLSGFVEDSWKVHPKFLLNAGLRYDVQLVPQPPHPYMASYNGAPSPLGNYYTNTIHINYKMVQPRVGFAWNPQVGTVVRGSYGIFYGLNSNSLYYTTRVENGVYQQQYNISSPTASNAIAAPNVLFAPPGPPMAAPFAGALTPTVVSGGGTLPFSFRGISPSFTNPYTHSWDLAVEQQLPFQSTLTLSYVGTRGMRLPYDIDINQPHATTIRTYQVLGSTVNAPQTTVTVPFTPYNTLRPSPNDGNVLVGFSGINSWYHAGTATLRKPFSHGLEILANYTWAHALDMSQGTGGPSVQNSGGGTFQGTNVILDPFNLKGHYSNGVNMSGEYGRSDLDIRGRAVLSLVYAPVFATQSKVAQYAVNGWQLSGTYTEQSGTPLTSLMSGELSGIYQGLDGGVTGLAVTENDSAGPGRVPFLPRNNTVYGGLHNLDARLGRTFPIHGQVKFDIFAEAFNVTNQKETFGVVATAYQYVNPGATAPAIPNSVLPPPTCPATNTAPCIAPFQSASAPFGQPNNTSGTLYGARQVQFAAKLIF